MIQKSVMSLCKSRNTTTPEKLCMLTATASVGHCKTKNGGGTQRKKYN